MELNAVVGLKRAIINREGLIQLNTEKLEGFQYAFYLRHSVEVWMDDTIRKVEKDICGDWSQRYGFDLEYYSFEKGLGRLTVSLRG